MALLFTVLLGLSAAIIGYFLYDFGLRNFIDETEAAIDAEIRLIVRLPASELGDYTNQANHRHRYFYLLMELDGSKRSGNLPAIPEHIQLLTEGVIQFDAMIEGEPHRLAAKIHTFADGTRILVARDIHDITLRYERLKWLAGLIILFMAMVVLTSFLISQFVVGRINRITNTAKDIMETGDLSKRLVIDSQWDDLSHLSQTLNQLLTRIEVLMQGVRDVSDSIAHDLRTPLTRLRNALEEHQQGGHISAEDIQLLLQEADNLLATFNSLLRISNIENAKRHTAFASLDLAEVLKDVIELYEPLAEEKAQTLHTMISTPFPLNGDRDLLFQMLANLLDNAIKFSPENSTIHLSLGNGTLCIRDEGLGVPASDMDKIFVRFFRGNTSRNTEGSGLGLSLVKAITDLHHAETHIRNLNPGLEFNIYFPNTST
jgi:signal transduction histidine kinase